MPETIEKNQQRIQYMSHNERWVISQLSNRIRNAKFSWGKRYSNHPVFQNSLDGILLIDSRKNICFTNPSFQSLYGGEDPSQLIGKPLMEIFSPAFQDSVSSMLELFEFTRVPTQPVEAEVCDSMNNIIPVCVWIAETSHNERLMTQLYIRDIAEWKKTQDYLTQANLELADAYGETLDGWGRALELRDHETEGHTRRVTEGTVQLALTLDLSIETITNLRYGAMLHDIGKMGIPDAILLKPGPLDANEWKVMKMHPVYARQMLSEISFLKKAVTIPYCHHEKWDGTGYPAGLKSEQIPVEARIFTIIDVWDALLSDRPYRKGWPLERVMSYILENKEIYFDPEIADIFLNTRS